MRQWTREPEVSNPLSAIILDETASMFSCFIIPKVYQSCNVRGQTERKEDEKNREEKSTTGGEEKSTTHKNKTSTTNKEQNRTYMEKSSTTIREDKV